MTLHQFINDSIDILMASLICALIVLTLAFAFFLVQMARGKL